MQVSKYLVTDPTLYMRDDNKIVIGTEEQAKEEGWRRLSEATGNMSSILNNFQMTSLPK
jgi:hypothetical protein